MLHLVFLEPRIAGNTGNAIRMVAGTGCELHLIEPLGFSLDDKQLRRAGLDYHEYASLQVHASWQDFLQRAQPDPARLFAMTTRGSHPVQAQAFRPGDWLVFGCETAGLPAAIRDSFPASQRLRPTHAPQACRKDEATGQ